MNGLQRETGFQTVRMKVRCQVEGIRFLLGFDSGQGVGGDGQNASVEEFG
jgi:hypothetical protein